MKIFIKNNNFLISMTKLNEGDFVQIDFNLYANGKLVQTTNSKLGKENNLEVKEFKPLIMILGKNFLLKALDEEIVKSGKSSNKLELTSNEAYGKRKKELLKTFTKSAFEEQKMRAVVGVTYDFNGMFGVVKSVIGGRVLVDFNNPLSGKNIILEYSNLKKIEDIKTKLSVVFETVLKLPSNIYEIKVDTKKVLIKLPAQLLQMKEQLEKSFAELIGDISNYELSFEELMPNKK